MDAVNQRTAQFTAHFQRLLALAWYALRSPKMTGSLAAALVIVALLGLLLPQQSTPRLDAASWISTLPPPVQYWGEPLFFLGFARIFQSVWFWLPAALLLLNSLVALADYGPGSWQRLGKTMPPIEWRHPLAGRDQRIVRLPQSPDTFLDTLRTSLKGSGFSLYQPVESEQRMIGAAQRGWAWAGLLAVYAGLILLVAALLGSHYFLKTERFTLFPLEARSNPLFAGKFELEEIEAGPGVGRVTYDSGAAGQSLQTLTWRLYQPAFFNNVLILPIASSPILVVEVRDSTNALLKVIPVQEDLPPTERLSLPLDEADTPLYFLIPANNVAVQISPQPTATENYNVQVRYGSESSPSENFMVSVGQAFAIDDMSVTLSLDRNLDVVAHRDPALPLYIISALLIGAGAVFTFIRPPVQIWLVPEVKGLGGQLYGVVEKLGSIEGAVQFLEQLLATETAQNSNNENSTADETQDSHESKM